MAGPENYLNRTGMERRLSELDALLDEASAQIVAEHPVASPEDFLAFEKAARAYGAVVAGMIVERKVIEAHLDPSFRKRAAHEARQRFTDAGMRQRIDNRGPRPAGVQLASGERLQVQTTYLRPSRKGLPGRPREKRGEGGSGCYPILEKLGIVDGATPLTRSLVAKQAVLCSSYAEAREQLASDGLVLDTSAIVRIAVGVGQVGLELRDHALDAAIDSPLGRSMVAGLRVRVSVDGGRARTRQTFTDRRKQKNGRRAFKLEWREPRIITVDILDEDGGMDKSYRPIYEVEIADANLVFRRLTGLLRLIGAAEAAEVVLVSDGADWIWNRLDALITNAEIPVENVRKVLDFYHASEHIMDALRACKFFNDTQRKQAHVDMSRSLLEPGGTDSVIERLRLLAKGRRAAKVNREIRYLEGHVEHMRYAEFRSAKVPIGSGIVESAVRRILNQRFKAASMCWRVDHLGPLLSLRAVLKSGRWDDFMMALLRRRYWLTCEDEAQAVAA